MRRIRLSNQAGRLLVALGLTLSIVLTPAIIPAAAGDLQAERFALTETKVVSLNATATEDGVLIEWRTSYEIDNVGFNLYREQDGIRTKVNRALIPGSALMVGEGVPLRGGNAYSAFDKGGTPDATYYLESADLQGKLSRQAPVRPIVRLGGLKPFEKSATDYSASSDGDADAGQSYWPAAVNQQSSANGAIEDQWVIASQPGLKIRVRQAGWYRLSQAELLSTGLDPSIDAQNLRMFVGAREMAIRVSRNNGVLVPGDFVEFYGTGQDNPWSDTQTYWLTGGTVTGRRIPAPPQFKHDIEAGGRPLPSNATPPLPNGTRYRLLPGEWFSTSDKSSRTSPAKRNDPITDIEANAVSRADDFAERMQPEEKPVTSRPSHEPGANTTRRPPATTAPAAGSTIRSIPVAVTVPAPRAAKSKKRKRRGRRHSRPRAVNGNHASYATTSATPNFLQVVERRDRTIYFSSLLNGETENFFGDVLISTDSILTNATTQTLIPKGVDLTASGPAQLEVALQGVNSANHKIIVFFNDVNMGTLNFSFRSHQAATFPVPIALLRGGRNDVKLVSVGGGTLAVPLAGSTTLIDYVRLTYPRRYRAKNNSLSFSAAVDQMVKVEGFSSPRIRLLDITDPLSVEEVHPFLETSGTGYAITVPPHSTRTTGERLLLAFAIDEFQQPAGVTLNQPSNLNANSNGGDLLIISPAAFLPSAASLESLRISQGLATRRVDVEDIFDEFNFGVRSPYALRDFLARAAVQWSPAPRYVILLGDGTYDPRNHQGMPSTDFVPTRLIDTVFMETASDDWLADFNDDGIPEMSVGRLPARTVAEANIMINKIVNFVPSAVPQSALMVADAQGSYYFNFELANDQVQALLPPSIAVQEVNRRTEPSDAAAKTNIIAKLNAGQVLVNYSGHGNVNAWSSGSIFTSSDAMALINGNKLHLAVVMNCLNGYFVEPRPLGEGLAEALLKAPGGGAVAAFASSGLTIPDGQHEMSNRLYQLLYGGTSLPLGDVVKQAKLATVDIDVRRTWIFFGDPSMKIR